MKYADAALKVGKLQPGMQVSFDSEPDCVFHYHYGSKSWHNFYNDML